MQVGLEKVPQEKKAFSPRVKFTSLNVKIVGKVNSPRKKVGERHVYPLRPIIPKGGPVSPRYEIKFTRTISLLQEVESFPQKRRL